MQVNNSLNVKKNGSPSSEVSDSTKLLKNNHLSALESLTLILLREIEEMKNEETRLNKIREGEKIHLYEELKFIEINFIRNALIRTGGHQVNAAKLLGMKLTTINSKIKRYKIDINRLSSDEILSMTNT